jgi:hypothetical protein
MKCPKQEVIYVIQILNKPYFKIGRSNCLQYRLMNLNQSIYEKFDIIHKIEMCCKKSSMKCERYLLEKLNQYKITNKKEWFEIHDVNVLNNYIEDIKLMINLE